MFGIHHKVAFRGARRELRTVAGIAAVTVLALGVTGCHSGSGTAGASGASPAPKATPAQPAPKDVLVAATAKLAKTRYKFTFDPGCSTTVSGVVDPQRKSSQVEERSPGRDTTMDMSLLAVDSQAWLKVNDEWMNVRGQTINSPLTGKWLHLDPAKIHGAEIPVMRDFFGGPAGPAGEAFQNVRDVQKAGDDTYTGRFDMSKTANLVYQSCLSSYALPSKAKFTARLDAQGRLAKVTFKVPYGYDMKGTPDATAVIEYSHYSSAEQPKQPPANQVVEAPAKIYDILV